jgi:hypothetical protein
LRNLSFDAGSNEIIAAQCQLEQLRTTLTFDHPIPATCVHINSLRHAIYFFFFDLLGAVEDATLCAREVAGEVALLPRPFLMAFRALFCLKLAASQKAVVSDLLERRSWPSS